MSLHFDRKILLLSVVLVTFANCIPISIEPNNSNASDVNYRHHQSASGNFEHANIEIEVGKAGLKLHTLKASQSEENKSTSTFSDTSDTSVEEPIALPVLDTSLPRYSQNRSKRSRSYNGIYGKFYARVRNLGDYDFVADMHVKNLFVFPASIKQYWARLASGDEKRFILQDKASCLPVTLLDPPKGSTVLDMCAAPGMKTTHLASVMRNKGKIYAVERDDRRYETLSAYVDGTKSTCVTAIQLDALQLEDQFVTNVEYILVDPSCSGSGMTNRLFVCSEKDPDRLANLTGLQSRMLSHAMRAFTKAKKIVYSTCSIHFEENEKVVQECLEMCPDWELKKPLEFAEKWKHFGSPKFKHIGKKCIYAKSEVDLTDGFFVAIFERNIDPSKPIEPYCRNKAVLEQMSWTLKPKYATIMTADLQSEIPNSVETVDLTDTNEISEDAADAAQKQRKEKKKRKDNVDLTEEIQIPENAIDNGKKKKRKDNGTASNDNLEKPTEDEIVTVTNMDVEEKTIIENNGSGTGDTKKKKKEKRKIRDEDDATDVKIIMKKSKKQK